MSSYQQSPVQAAPEKEQGGFDPLSLAPVAMAGMAPLLGPLGPVASLLGNGALNTMMGGGCTLGAQGVEPDGGAGGQTEGGGSVFGWLGDVVGDMGGKLGEAWDTATDTAGDAWDTVSGWAGSAWDTATETAGNAWDTVSGWGSSAVDWASNKASEIGQWGSDFAGGVAREGWTSVFDPVGTADREAAHRELSDRFQVVGDDFVGPRLPNQVTQSEYDRICSTYSDIRLGRGDLTIDPSALGTDAERDAYRSGAMNDIASLLQTESGRQLVYQLHNNTPQTDASGNPIHRRTTMVPLLAADGTLDRTNGYASPDGGGSTYTENADGTRTRGSGTDVHIRYNPGVNIGDAYPTLTPTNPWLGDFRSDVLLMHEMNHAMHQTAGTGDSRSIQATDNPANASDPETAYDASNGIRRIEHQAAGLGMYSNDPMTENRYRAERRLIGSTGMPGAQAGDATLSTRTSYVPHNPPATAPGASGVTPGLPPFVHRHDHGDHDHDHD